MPVYGSQMEKRCGGQQSLSKITLQATRRWLCSWMMARWDRQNPDRHTNSHTGRWRYWSGNGCVMLSESHAHISLCKSTGNGHMQNSVCCGIIGGSCWRHSILCPLCVKLRILEASVMSWVHSRWTECGWKCFAQCCSYLQLCCQVWACTSGMEMRPKYYHEWTSQAQC